MKTLFFTGATGFIGGTVLSAVITALDENKIDTTFRVLVRTEAKKDKLVRWAKVRGYNNIVPVLGTLDDFELFASEVEGADFVVDCADCDSMPGARALVEGLQRAINNKKSPVVVHTSGTNILCDWAHGMKQETKVVHDADQAEIDAVPEDNPHRDVDVLLTKFYRDNSDKYDQTIIVPPTIWGLGRGPDIDTSVQIPLAIRYAIKNRQAYSVGKGINVWTHINVVDLAAFYAHILVRMIKEPRKHTGYYLCENGEFEWREVIQEVQKALVQNGFSTSREHKEVYMEDGSYEKIFGKDKVASFAIGNNSRSKGTRARESGWEPKVSSRELFFAHIADQVHLIADREFN